MILPYLKEAIKEYYGENPKLSESYARIINARHFQSVNPIIKIYFLII
jgi:hypothetical protein